MKTDLPNWSTPFLCDKEKPTHLALIWPTYNAMILSRTQIDARSRFLPEDFYMTTTHVLNNPQKPTARCFRQESSPLERGTCFRQFVTSSFLRVTIKPEAGQEVRAP